MLELPEIMRMAQMKARHSAARQSVIAENIAHADTPGFTARDIKPFAEIYASTAPLKVTRPGHLGASGAAPEYVPVADMARGVARSPNGNAVSLEREMIRAVEARHGHDMALGIYASARHVLRTALGR